MKPSRRLFAILLVLAMLLTNSGMTALAEAVMNMPAALQIIDEEAFYGSTSIDKVVLSDNVTEIRARAFANSSLSEINLPDSITFIAEDAFDGPEKVTVTANPGTYAYNWAVDHNYISDSDVYSVSVSASSEQSAVGQSVTWTATAQNGVEPYKYRFYVYKGDTRKATRAYNASPEYTYTFTESGDYYVSVTCRDDDGETVTIDGGNVHVGEMAITGLTVTSDVTECINDTPVTFTATFEGGTAPFEYEFTLYRDSTSVATSGKIADPEYTFTPEEAGLYTVTVKVSDATGEEFTATSDTLTVAGTELAIVSITANEEWIRTGEDITWTTVATGGKKPLRYAFDIMIDGEEMEGTSFSTSNTTIWTTDTAGVYTVNARVRDANNVRVELVGGEVNVYDALRLNSVTADVTACKASENITWTVDHEGGKNTVIYEYTVQLNGEAVYTKTSVNPILVYTPMRTGSYILTVTATDEAEDTATATSDMVAVSEHETSPTEDFTFNVLNGTYCSITGYTGSDASLFLPFDDGNGHFVQTIASNAFNNSSTIENVVLSSRIESIGSNAFSNCINLSYVDMSSSHVETIDSCAFYGCTKLTDLILPEGLLTIGGEAFENCTSLVSVVLPDSVTTIWSKAFRGCTKLSSINFPLDWVTMRTSSGYSGSDGYNSIYWSPFYGCTRLTTIVIPEGVTAIPAYAFYRMTSLSEVVLPSTLDVVGGSSFTDCTGLTTVNFNNTLVSIGSSAFSGCSGLTEIQFPSSLKTLSDSAFSNCSGLTSVEFSDGLTQINSSVFSGCTSLSNLVLPAKIKTVGSSAFYGCTKLAYVKMNGVETIDSSAFSGCTKLTDLILPEGLLTIGGEAFENCTSLVSVVLPDSVTTIWSKAFRGCTKLSSINFPLDWVTMRTSSGYSGSDGYNSIYWSPFYGCTRLTTIVIPEGVTTIPNYAFYNMTSLKGINLPSTLRTIGSSSFQGCTSMEAIYISDNVTSISNDAFNGHNAEFTIHGKAESYAETYATNNNIPFSAEPLAVTYGSIHGSIVDPDGNAVSGASVALSRYGTGNVEFQTTTASNGSWVINNIPVGYQYQVSYVLDGYSFPVDNRVCTATESGYNVGSVVATPVNAAALNSLNLSISSWTGASEDAQRYFTVSSVGGWYVESKPDWATVYADESGSGATPRRVLMAPRSVSSTTSDAVLILENNDSLTNRQGDIIISNGSSSATVSITQLPDSYEGMAVQFTYPNANTISINEATELTISLEAINFKYGELSIITPNSQDVTVISFTDAAFSYPYTFRETGEYTVFATVYGNDRILNAGDGVSRPSVQTQEFTIVVTRSTSTSLTVKTSAQGVQLIKDYESFRSTPYVDGNTDQYDASGHRLYHWSIGYGEQLPDLYSMENPPQITMTEEEASVSLLKKLAQREAMVDDYLSRWGVTLSTAQYDAVMSFNWNFWPDSVFTDTSNFESFQRLIKKYANGGSADSWEVYRTFVLYHHSNGTDNIGLFKRRMTEANLFVTGDYSTRNWDYVALGADTWFMVPDADGVVRRGLSVPSDWYKNQVVQSLTIAVTSYSYNKTGGTESIDISGSTAWEARSDSNWITVVKTATGYGVSSLTYRVDANTTANRRTGHVIVIDSVKNKSVTLTIVQEGTTATNLSVTLKPISIRSGAEVKLGSLFGFTAVGTGGEGTYTYTFEIQKMNDAGVYDDYTWTNKFISFPQNDTVALEADTHGFFRVCATVTDGNGSTAQVYDTFSVSWTDPIVYDASFADGNYYDKEDMPTVRWEKHTSAFYYRVKIVELAQVGTTSVHYVIPENGLPSDEGLMVMTNSIDLSQYTFKNSQTYRMWVGAYSVHGIRIAQSEFIFSTNPLQSINVSLSSAGTQITGLVPKTDDLTVSWASLIPNSAWNRSVAFYRANIRDDNTMAWIQSVKANCAHMPADQTSFTVPKEELYRGHSYTMWLAAFTKEGARIGQACVVFTVDGSIIWGDPVTTVTTTLNADRANSSSRAYVNECINARIWLDREWNRNLSVGKAVVFFFEGAGANSSSDQRQFALCVVVKNNAAGVPEIVFQNEYCTTIPDKPKQSATSLSYVNTLMDGQYNIQCVNWKHGKALYITPDTTVQFDTGDLVDGRYGVSNDLLIHQRWQDDNTISSQGTVNSAGCTLIGKRGSGTDCRDTLYAFLEAVNGGPLNSWPQGQDMGCVIVDRSLAREYLTAIYGANGAKKISPAAFN